MAEEEYDYDAFRPVSPSAAFFILIGLLGAGVIIGSLVGFAFWYGMTGRGFTTFEKDLLNPDFTNAARTMQMISVLIMFFIPALVTARLMSRKPFTWLGYREGFNQKQVLLVVAITLVCFPLVGALGELNHAIPISKSLETYFKKLEDNYNSQVAVFATMRSVGDFIFSLIVMALFPAIFEETLFRGGLQQVLITWFKRPMIAIVVTSIIFSLIHFSYYGFLPRFALGVVLGLIFYYSKSIWLNMVLHFLNNGIAICYMYWLTTHGKPIKDVSEENAPIWVGLPALIIVILLLRMLQKISFKRSADKKVDKPSFDFDSTTLV